MAEAPLKIRWINPIGIPDYDKSIAELIAKYKSPEVEFEVVSYKMQHSPHDLEYLTYEGLVMGDTVRVARDAAEKNFDGVVIGCFYDTGLPEAQNISGKAIITAPCLSSLQIITHLANKFSVIVGQQSWVDQMQATIVNYGYGRQLVSLRPVGLSVEEFQADPAKTRELMLEQAIRAVHDDHAEALILGCTIEYGFYADLQKEVGVPVIDCTLASIKTIEWLAGMKRQFDWNPSRVGGCKPPPEEDLKKWKVFDQPAPIGNSIWVPEREDG